MAKRPLSSCSYNEHDWEYNSIAAFTSTFSITLDIKLIFHIELPIVVTRYTYLAAFSNCSAPRSTLPAS